MWDILGGIHENNSYSSVEGGYNFITFSREKEKDNLVSIMREDKVRRCRRALTFFKALLYLVCTCHSFKYREKFPVEDCINWEIQREKISFVYCT